jgi:hypothetical protein
MPPKTPDIKTWLDSRGMTAQEAASLFGVETQTIFNWRSQGVPERRRLHVESVMANHETAGTSPLRWESKLTISPTWDQIENWMAAARKAGKSPERWAIDGLADLAQEELSRLERVAETPPDEYKPDASTHQPTKPHDNHIQ